MTGHLPVYRVVTVEGPEHQPRFTVEVEVSPGVVAVGSGSTKQGAEQQAAERLLESWVTDEASSEEGQPT